MSVLAWIVIIFLFVVAFVGLVYPIIPSVLLILAGFFAYGFLFTFERFGWLFWLIQGLFVVLIFGADYIANMVGIKKYGGSNAGIWGSTIGLLVGPFVIPVFGILIGPFLGAILAEMIINKKRIKEAITIGFGSVIGFVSSVITKGVVQVMMIIYFFMVVR